MSAPLAVVAGATGSLGRHVTAQLLQRGYRVRALGRNPKILPALGATQARAIDLTNPSSLRGVCDDATVVIACAGALMSLGTGDPAGFMAVDYHGNAALLAEARRAGVSKFVYVSLAGALSLRNTEYARAHEMFASDLAATGLAYTVVRPTGFFSMFAATLPLAARNLLAIPGDGLARTNPIHEADVASACVTAIPSPEVSLPVGGPEIFTRLRIAEMTYESLGKPGNVRQAPLWVGGIAARLTRLVNPRLSALIEFGSAIGAVDIIAPAFGTHRLGDYLRERAAAIRLSH